MCLVFVDRYGCEGEITDDGVVEYDGPFEGSIEGLVATLDWETGISPGELQDLSIELFAEGNLSEIRTVGDRDRREG